METNNKPTKISGYFLQVTLVATSGVNRLLGRPRLRLEDNIKLDPKQRQMMWNEVTWVRSGETGRSF